MVVVLLDSMTFAKLIAEHLLKPASWRLLALLLTLLLSACGAQQITVAGKYPTPLVETLPLKLGLHLKPEFQQHQYHYQPKDSREIELIMETGASQTEMITTVTNAMFEQVQIVEEFPVADSSYDVDAVLVPIVESFQHAIPNHTKINVFEIWVRYRFQLLTPGGETIADWYMSSYGKTPSQFMESAEESIRLAAVVAFRDAGANFSLNFSRVPEVKQWLDGSFSDEISR